MSATAKTTRLARRMVTRWAMTDFGLMALDLDEEQPFLGYEIAQGRNFSEETAARIDEEVQKLLQERYAYTRTCLEEHRSALDELATALMEHETINQETLEEILGPDQRTNSVSTEIIA